MSNSSHGRTTTTPLTFTDADVSAPTHAERARTLAARHTTGSLATVAIEPAGYPYASFVTFALAEGEPVFLISRLAEHTRNLLADARASLLVHDSDSKDPLANARVTLVGRAVQLVRGAGGATDDGGRARDAFLATHPQAAYYADYADFDFWRLTIEAVRYIGGYGRMSWVGAEEFRQAEPDPLAKPAAYILEHMNTDHAPALVLYARAFTQAFDAEAATMTAIDRHGFEMTVNTPRGIGPARIAFATPLTSGEQAREALVALVRAAEAKLASGAH
jgi:putative heme iron utilization protein